jgi:hypothetical protein
MGNNPSQEAGGVVCAVCRAELPPNDYSFCHIENGALYAFYS